jgi:Xaa-Pro aminopeptidase
LAVLRTHLARACTERRQRLVAALGSHSAVFPAGSALARNYAANTHPYRASSHFLYLVGMPIEGALLLVDGGEWLLFVPTPAPDDDMWHGPTPSRDEIAAATGLQVRALDDFSKVKRTGHIATVPRFDGREARELASLLGRAPDSLGTHPDDEPLLEALIQVRLYHDEAAVVELRRAAEASVRAHVEGMRHTEPGRYEREVCGQMEAVFAREGFSTAYGSIVTVHGEVLHNHHHHLCMREGDLLLADVGAETDTGYAADITRTWPVSGRFSATQRDVYEVVLESQRAAIASVRPGMRYRDVHIAAARSLTDGLVRLGILRGEVDGLVEQGAHALFFPHGIGHLLGLDVHDMEDLGDRAGYAAGRTRATQFGLSYLRLDRDLEPGMLVTIEPGFYQVPSILRDPARLGIDARVLDRERLRAFADVRGIRIEDDVLVTTAGSDVLTKALPKSVADVEATVGRA